MKPFIAFIRKEFYHIFRDARTLIFIFVIPVTLLFVFGYALDTEIKNAKIAILDEAKDLHSFRLTDKILSSGYFQFYKRLSSFQEVEAAFRDGKIKMAILFPANFTENFEHGGGAQIQLVGDASDPNTAVTLINYANAVIIDYQLEQNKSGFQPLYITTSSKILYNPHLASVYAFVPGVIVLVLTLISAMLTAITLAREKELGNMEVLLVSPLRPWQIIFGKVVPYLILSIFNTAILLFIGILVFKVPMRGDWSLLAGECFLFILTSLSLGVLISTFAETQLIAMFESLLTLLMPTMLLTGFIFPIENMPKFLQYVSNILPATWFMQTLRDISLKGVGLDVVWKPTIILTVMTILFIGLSVKNFKNKI